MSYRFKASKYKNSTPKVPKKLEGWILDVSVGSPQCFGNNIKASAAFVAFSTDTRGGGSLAVCALEDSGRKNKAMPLLHAHAEMITDFDFSPFDDGLLATGSQDRYVKLWRIRNRGGLTTSGHSNSNGSVDLPANPELCLPPFQSRVETLGFHPSVDSLLVTAHGGNVALWDVSHLPSSSSSSSSTSSHHSHNKDGGTVPQQLTGHSNHSDVVQSVSWKSDGSLLISSGRDRLITLWDPRAQQIAQECKGHANQRDSRIQWLGDSNVVLTTGFGSSREREAAFRDVRKLDQPLSQITGESSLGILIPLYDPDTKMLFMAAKADTTVYFYEVLDKDPYYCEGAIRFSGEVQVKGVGLVPKRALQVMTGEVNRVLLLGADCVVPLKYTVPRKSYRDFHPDLFPDTPGADPSMLLSEWQEGKNVPLRKISLDPMNRPPGGLVKAERVLGGALPENPYQSSMGGSNKSGITSSTSNRGIGGQHQGQGGHSVSRSNSMSSGGGGGGGPRGSETTANTGQSGGGVPSPALLRRSQHSITREWEEMITTDTDNNSSTNGKPSKPPKPLLCPKPFVSSSTITVPSSSNKRSSSSSSSNGERSSSPDFNSVHQGQGGGTSSMSMSAPGPPGSSSPPVVLRRPLQTTTNTNTPVGTGFTGFTGGGGTGDLLKTPVEPQQPRRSRFSVRVTKFRHLNGDVGRKETHITNLCKLSKSVPGESDAFQVNPQRAALPLAGEGGHLAILELGKRGRMQSGVVPSLICGATIMDFAWDPFDPTRLAVGCDDGCVQLWSVPSDGLSVSVNEPSGLLRGHTEKVQIVKFHPTASNLLASASHDLTVRLWDLQRQQQKLVLNGHTDQIFSLCWSPCGRILATVCKDQKLRLFDPRASPEAVAEGPGPQGSRGARVVWVMGGTHLVTTGFSRVSERLISLYEVSDISLGPSATEGLDVSPSILVPFYDEDSSTLFLTGRGDNTVYAYEVARDGACFHPLSHYKCSGSPHQAVAYLPKNACDVAKVEFAKSFRLTPNSIEPLTFSVPRLRKEFFQDDLFPPTRVTWSPALSGSDWLAGSNKEAKRVSLRPEGMPPLSEAPSAAKNNSGLTKGQELQGGFGGGGGGFGGGMQFEGEVVLESSLAFLHGNKQKEERIIRAMTDKLNYEGQNLPQDSCEGVDPNEWEDDSNNSSKTQN